MGEKLKFYHFDSYTASLRQKTLALFLSILLLGCPHFAQDKGKVNRIFIVCKEISMQHFRT